VCWLQHACLWPWPEATIRSSHSGTRRIQVRAHRGELLCRLCGAMVGFIFPCSHSTQPYPCMQSAEWQVCTHRTHSLTPLTTSNAKAMCTMPNPPEPSAHTTTSVLSSLVSLSARELKCDALVVRPTPHWTFCVSPKRLSSSLSEQHSLRSSRVTHVHRITCHAASRVIIDTHALCTLHFACTHAILVASHTRTHAAPVVYNGRVWMTTSHDTATQPG
jgi:hypothetical protein